MTGSGIEPGTPASLVRCSLAELSMPISTVHLTRTTTFLPPYKVFAILSGLIKYKCLNREGHGTKCSRDGRIEQIQRSTNENVWLDQESNPGPLHH